MVCAIVSKQEVAWFEPVYSILEWGLHSFSFCHQKTKVKDTHAKELLNARSLASCFKKRLQMALMVKKQTIYKTVH